MEKVNAKMVRGVMLEFVSDCTTAPAENQCQLRTPTCQTTPTNKTVMPCKQAASAQSAESAHCHNVNMLACIFGIHRSVIQEGMPCTA